MAGIGFLVIMTFTCFAGIIMFAYYYGCDPIQAGVRHLSNGYLNFVSS